MIMKFLNVLTASSVRALLANPVCGRTTAYDRVIPRSTEQRRCPDRAWMLGSHCSERLQFAQPSCCS